MSTKGQQFPFVARASQHGAASLAPMLPLTLVGTRSDDALGLLDWDQQTTAVQLSGNLAIAEARAILVSAVVGSFAPVRLAFAWAKVDTVPVILGQINFFLEFDVCFFRARRIFEVRPVQRP